MLKSCCVFIAVVAMQGLNAQEKPGRTSGSLLLLPKTLFSIDTSDKQAALHLLRDIDTEPLAYIFLFEAGIDQGKTTLFQGDTLGSKLAGTLELRYRLPHWVEVPTPNGGTERKLVNSSDYLFVRPTLGTEAYKTFIGTDPQPDRLQKQRLETRGVRFGYRKRLSSMMIGAISYGYAETSNADDLDDAEVKNTVDLGNGDTIVTTEQVKLGRLARKFSNPFSLDAILLGDWIDPGKTRYLGYAPFLRKDFRDSGSDWIPGISVYLFESADQSRSPDTATPSAGISLALKDGKVIGTFGVGIKF